MCVCEFVCRRKTKNKASYPTYTTTHFVSQPQGGACLMKKLLQKMCVVICARLLIALETKFVNALWL